MGWATAPIVKLQSGETIQLRPRGNSMVGKISSGQLCTVVPLLDDDVLKKGEIVLCKVKGAQYLHLIKPYMAAPLIRSPATRSAQRLCVADSSVDGCRHLRPPTK